VFYECTVLRALFTTTHGLLRPNSNNFFEIMANLKKVLLAKGLWHIYDPSASMAFRPIVKIEKGASSAPGYQPPIEYEHSILEFNAAALQNHEVVLLISNSLDFALHHLLEPHPEPPLNELRRTVYLQIDHHFRHFNEWVKQKILARWENIALTNPRDTYNTITGTFHEAISTNNNNNYKDTNVDISNYSAAVKYAQLIQPLNPAYNPILMEVMSNQSSTLEGTWPTVVSIGNLLPLTAPPCQPEHAHQANAYQTPRRTDRPP
jgi:hypothetical protein